ncbi:MAG: flippase-like domain-containing protein [Phycisphaerales bacterium]|nr:flippase-like domain-containing protein [Phycisphaerales bacterium]
MAGVLLLAAAIRAVWSQRPVLDHAMEALRDAPAWLVAAAFILPLVSWLATSATFWLLSNRYARVPARDMTLLIGAAWLLNHLPLRPGMFGRIAYHKKYHHMAVRDALRVMVAAMILSIVSLAFLLGIAAAVSRLGSPEAQAALLAAPTLVAGLTAVVARALGRSWWREAAALCARSIDMLSWVARYAIVFMLVGRPLSTEHVVAIAAVCQVAMVVPVTGNGIGLREWAVGLTLFAVSSAGSREEAATIGLAADLVNRAAETILALPIGLACSWILARGVRRAGRSLQSPDLVRPEA